MLTLKARAETLEEQNRKMRSKMGIVLEKTKTDDALVDALRGELNEVRQSLYQSIFQITSTIGTNWYRSVLT